jgi:hypothetical protein
MIITCNVYHITEKDSKNTKVTTPYALHRSPARHYTPFGREKIKKFKDKYNQINKKYI